jgi:hypothetical protein
VRTPSAARGLRLVSHPSQGRAGPRLLSAYRTPPARPLWEGFPPEEGAYLNWRTTYVGHNKAEPYRDPVTLMQTRSLQRTPSPQTRTRSSIRDRNEKDPTSESSKHSVAPKKPRPKQQRLEKHPKARAIRGTQKKPAGGRKPFNIKAPTRCGSPHHLNSQVPTPMIRNRFSRMARPPSRLLSMNAKRFGQHPGTCEARPPNGGPSISVSL